MSSQTKKPVRSFDRSDPFDLDTLLHPAGAFAHPADVVHDPDLSLNEKRAILASWASDACAVEAAPALRKAPGAARLGLARWTGQLDIRRRGGQHIDWRPGRTP